MRRVDDPFEHLMLRAVRLESGCLVLPKHRERPKNYPTMKAYGRTMKIHRFVFEHEKGETDLLVCHTCDYPPCFEPTHLFSGTQSDNMIDMYSKGRGFDQTLPKNFPDMSGDKNPNWKGGISADPPAYHRAWRAGRKVTEGA